MVLHNPVEENQIAVDVIEDFHFRRLGPQEKQCSATGKDFDVAFVGRNSGISWAARQRFPPIHGIIWLVMGKPLL